MGCTPSIHVSQTGIVYCRGSEDSNSPHPTLGTAAVPSVNSQVDVVGQASASNVVTPVTTISALGSSTTTTPSPRRTKMRSPFLKVHDDVSDPASRQMMPTDVSFGPMVMRQQSMSVLLVFGKDDSQSEAFLLAAEKAQYQCHMVNNAKRGLECFLDQHHDLIIMDTRHTKHFDAETMCRSIRATKASDHTVIIAVTKKTSGEEPTIVPLLKAGFNRRFTENPSVSVCMNELLSIEYGEVRMQTKLRGAQVMMAAVDTCSEPVYVTDDQHKIQYVNPAYERLFGYTSEELSKRDISDLQADRNHSQLLDTINQQLIKGKMWDGTHCTRRKSGESLYHHTKAVPVMGKGGSVSHFVYVKSGVPDGIVNVNKYNDISPMSSGSIQSFPRRKESMARIHSMTIEAPITKVINIINTAQENSPITVSQELDKVLEILHSSELYAPYFSQHLKDDPMTTDLVGGLMASQQMKKRFSSDLSKPPLVPSVAEVPTSPTTTTTTVSNVFNTLSQISPDIRKVLNREPYWDFDVISLEKLTQKRPLLYLGLQTFQRFGVQDFLRVGEQQMVAWLQMIESNYHSRNSYHNSTHAADVMNCAAYFLSKDRCKNVFDQMDEVGTLLAAVIHDLDHPGFTNSFLVNAGSQLALLYNDQAVLESHHVSLAFLLSQRDDKVNIFKNLDKETYRELRQQIIDMVLATEMTKHFEHLSKFVQSISNPSIKDEEGDHDDTASVTSNRPTSPENKKLIKRILIKCADVSNPVRPRHLCTEWATRIAKEYFNQTDEERRRGLPSLMPIFDRKTCNVPKSQSSFIDFFIKDMYNEWDSFCGVEEVVEHLHNNYEYWKAQEEVSQKELMERDGHMIQEEQNHTVEGKS